MGFISADIIEECNMYPDSHILVALSGGSDSVALLLSLTELKKEGKIRDLTAAHFNHCLRGSESDEDCAFCTVLCKRLGIVLKTSSEDVSAYAEQKKIGIEEAARICRYRFLRRVKQEVNANSIALAHHADDQLETVLMHLIRGSGLKGLCGMQMKNGDLIRPFLRVTKREILVYLSELKQDFREDSSNTELCYERNRIRKEVIPLLESLRPDMSKRATIMADGLQQDEAYLQMCAENARSKAETADGAIDCEILVEEASPVRNRVLLNILREHLCFDMTGAQLRRLTELLYKQSGKTVPIKGNLTAFKDGKYLRLAMRSDENPSQKEIRPGESADFGDWIVRLEETDEYRKPKNALEAIFSADDMDENPVFVLRRKEAGDSFQPLGMHEKKLISDIYTDRKMADSLRKAPVLVYSGEIVFVPGYTICEKKRILEGTKKMLHIYYEEEQNNGKHGK